MQSATCDCRGGLLFPQSGRRRSVAKKVFLRAACFRLFFLSIPMRVDRGIDREETAVAAVSEKYRGDNVLGMKTSPTGSASTVDEISCDSSLLNKDKHRITYCCYG